MAGFEADVQLIDDLSRLLIWVTEFAMVNRFSIGGSITPGEAGQMAYATADDGSVGLWRGLRGLRCRGIQAS